MESSVGDIYTEVIYTLFIFLLQVVIKMSRDSSIKRLAAARRPGLGSLYRHGSFSSATTKKPATWPTQPSIQLVPEALSTEGKTAGA
jgi:hypothetical protein